MLRSYRYAEPLRQEAAPGRSFYLEANLSHAIATLNESGMPVDFEFGDVGDVFEHVETMVRLGDAAMGQIEQELQQQASIGPVCNDTTGAALPQVVGTVWCGAGSSWKPCRHSGTATPRPRRHRPYWAQ